MRRTCGIIIENFQPKDAGTWHCNVRGVCLNLNLIMTLSLRLNRNNELNQQDIKLTLSQETKPTHAAPISHREPGGVLYRQDIHTIQKPLIFMTF